MPLFIRKQVNIIESDDTNPGSIREVLWSRDDLVTLVAEDSPALIEFTEAHAAAVIRPQGKYQEIPDDVIAEARADTPTASKAEDRRLKAQRGRK